MCIYTLDIIIHFVSSFSFEEQKILHRFQSLNNLKKHQNIMCYYSFWIERAPSNWQHKKNWSQLMQNIWCTGSPEENELPLFAMALTDSISKDTLSDWLYRSVPDRPMDVVITFFEQVYTYKYAWYYQLTPIVTF